MAERILKHHLVEKAVKKLYDAGERIVIGGNKVLYKKKYHLKYTQEIVRNVLDTVLQIITEEVANGNSVVIYDYLAIKPEYGKARKVRNLRKNTMMMIPPKYRLKITGGKKLADACNYYNETMKEENQIDET